MSRISDLIIVMVFSFVILVFSVQQQLQVVRALNIKADFNLDETQPGFQTGHVLYSLKNIRITNTAYPTEFVPSMGEKFLLDVDPDQVFLQSTLVTHTSSHDSNISNAILALPIDTIKNYTTTETISTDKNRGWVNLNGHLIFGTVGMINIDKILKHGTLLISTDNLQFSTVN